MKIGILTQPLQSNYGGIIQAYALQTILESMGHEVVILNRIKLEKDNTSLNLKRRCLENTKKNIKKIISCPQEKSLVTYCVCKKIEPFVNKYLHKTSDLSTTQELKRFAQQSDIEAFVVGSDQVWRPDYSPCITNYFLDFTEGWNVKRIAYAASFGVDYWEFSEEETKKCSRLVQMFDAVSVREISGVTLAKRYINISATHVLDPTLLLKQIDYVKLIENERTVHPKGNVFCYILDCNPVKKKKIEETCKEKGLKSYYCNAKKYFFAPNIELGTKPSVTYWLQCFRDAKYVIVDSFHGTVFSIIFNKPFVAIGNKERGLSRFESLLSIFGLEDRLIANYEQIEEILYKPIDWEKVNNLHNINREESIRFLLNSLS